MLEFGISTPKRLLLLVIASGPRGKFFLMIGP